MRSRLIFRSEGHVEGVYKCNVIGLREGGGRKGKRGWFVRELISEVVKERVCTCLTMLLTLCSEVYLEGGIRGGGMLDIGCRRWVVLCSLMNWGNRPKSVVCRWKSFFCAYLLFNF